MNASFNQQFDQLGAWRREFGLRLKLLREWLVEHELLDAAVEERLERLESRLTSDKIMVAFVAEFSRGKSELINAIFFAGYGRRIMPASAGRTTMCPTELGFDPAVPACLRLLPIETRRQPQPLMEWRAVPEQWTRIDLDVNDAAQLAEAMAKVAETRRVSRDEARALGFWHDDRPDDNPMADEAGLVEVPRWRHALINLAHPLLKRGLVVLDTPGLNAIGAEPELTVNLIPQAHAVVFILAADTGVTKSDQTIWREHLLPGQGARAARVVVLNKIDTLWDPLSSPIQVHAQIDRQIDSSAELLGVPRQQVVAVSAQKGLVAKVNGDDMLLQASRLPELESLLSEQLLANRQAVLGAAVATSVQSLRDEVRRVMHIRRRDLAEQMLELKGLRGKNQTVIRQMRARIEQEQAEFDASGSRVLALRSVHLRQLREVFDLLGAATLRRELDQLALTLGQPGMKLGVKRAYLDSFDRLKATLARVRTANDEIQQMLAGTFRQLNAEFGFSLQAPGAPDMAPFEQDLDFIERSHLQYLGVSNLLRLSQPDYVQRLIRALGTRLRGVFETALGEVELWNKSSTAQLNAQLRERRRNFTRRIEAIERIQDAAGHLEERLQELDQSEQAIDVLEIRLAELTSYLSDPGPRPMERTVEEPALRLA